MALFAVLGVLLTVLALTLLGLGGYLAALRLLAAQEESRGASDPLLLAVSTLVLATAQAVAVGLVLGVAGVLRFELALGLQTLLVFVLYRGLKGRTWGGESLGGPARRVAGRTWARLREHPVLAVVAVHAAGTELLRGLFRPPLSWDSLMYHLQLTGTWLQRGDLEPVAAMRPFAFYQFMPGNGSLWLWWWMAPSHSELYVNLAAFPHWLLLGLGTGAVARSLGARRHWPVAAFLVVMVPTVVRFVATQYVDILVGALMVAGTWFAMRWLRRPEWADALLAAAAVGLAVGTKVLALPYAAGLAVVVPLLARGGWRCRLPHLAAAALVAALLGGFYYARNLSYGAGPFVYDCAGQTDSELSGDLPRFPSTYAPVREMPRLLREGLLSRAFLGTSHLTLGELGIGPQVVLLLPVILLLPWLVTRGVRRGALLAWSQVGVQGLAWLTLSYAAGTDTLSNVRYLTGAVALLFAAAVAAAEPRIPARWLRGLAIVLAVQDLLMLDARLPQGVRWLLLGALALLAMLAFAPRVGRIARRRRRLLVAGAALLLLTLIPAFAAFRVHDRHRAFREDYIAHRSTTRLFADGWEWLDTRGGAGTVAVAHAPETYFVYPAMGPFLSRRALYVNVNEEDFPNPALYPACDPRVDPSADAWIGNLEQEGARWVYLARYPEVPFPLEQELIEKRPQRFALRYANRTNLVYEILPPSPAGEPGGQR